jgi:hypothetical protein
MNHGHKKELVNTKWRYLRENGSEYFDLVRNTRLKDYFE